MNYCIKCKADLSKPGVTSLRLGNDYYCTSCLKCSFCQKGLTSSCHRSPDKPGMISCMDDKCHSELKKPKNYDPNAIVKNANVAK